MQYDTAR